MLNEFRSISGNLSDDSVQALAYGGCGKLHPLSLDAFFHIRSSATDYLPSGLFVEILLFLD